MKRAIALIELIFAIVIMGICLSAVPRVAQSVSENTAFSVKQEYLYELKGLYGILRNMPYEANNYCKSYFDTNGIAANYCMSIKNSSYYENSKLNRLGIDDRFGEPDALKGITIASDQTTFNYEFKYYNILKAQLTYKLREGLDFVGELSKTGRFQIELEKDKPLISTGDSKHISIGLLKVINNSSRTTYLSIYVPFTKFGRLNNLYPRKQLKE